MKLKLGQGVMSRTKRFFQPEAREFDRAGALIRRGSLRAATRCSRLGSNTDAQFQASLKEFLAFFCVIMVNELAMKSGRQSEDELKAIYRKLVEFGL